MIFDTDSYDFWYENYPFYSAFYDPAAAPQEFIASEHFVWQLISQSQEGAMLRFSSPHEIPAQSAFCEIWEAKTSVSQGFLRFAIAPEFEVAQLRVRVVQQVAGTFYVTHNDEILVVPLGCDQPETTYVIPTSQASKTLQPPNNFVKISFSNNVQRYLEEGIDTYKHDVVDAGLDIAALIGAQLHGWVQVEQDLWVNIDQQKMNTVALANKYRV